MATGASSIRALAVLWLLVPAPVVFLLLVNLRPGRGALRVAGSAYLAVSAALTLAVLFGVAWIGSERAIHPAQCEELPALSEYPELQTKAQEVRFQSKDGINLAGWLIPGDRKAAVLLLHGYRCRRDEMLPHADMLHRAGYTVLLFDFRSRGQSEGDAVTLGFKERLDALGAIDYLKTRPEVDSGKIGVLGISQGGATAILAAATSPDLKAVASESAFKSADSVVSQSFTHFIHLPAFPFAPLTVWIAELRVGIESEEIVPEREVARISPRPVLVMHGVLDTTISPRDGEAIFAAAREPKQWWLIPDSAHAQGARKAAAEYERRIVAFFDANLK
jgi:dipeptidyl aminopeptidase/acylaminoacyl peptidase